MSTPPDVAPIAPLEETFEQRTIRHTAEDKLVGETLLATTKNREEAVNLMRIYVQAVESGSRQSRKNSNKLIRERNAEIKKIKEQEAELAKLTNPAQQNKKRAEIANLEINRLCYDMQIADAKTHFEFFEKLNTATSLNPTPETIKNLKAQTAIVNNAIEQQQELVEKLKENEKATNKKSRTLTNEQLEKAKGMLTKPVQEQLKDIQDIKEPKDRLNALKYIQNERARADSHNQYEISRKIFQNAATNINTTALQQQFAHLKNAINNHDAFRKKLAASEDNKLKKFNAQIMINAKIAKIKINATQKNKEKKQKKLAALGLQLAALEKSAKEDAQRAEDDRRLYDLSNKLMQEAMATGDAKKLAEQLEALTAVAKQQNTYVEGVKKVKAKLATAKENLPKGEKAAKDRELRINNLTRKEADATLADAMMRALIQKAEREGTSPEVLKQQCDALKKGFGDRKFGQTKNRRALKKAEKTKREKEIAREDSDNTLLAKGQKPNLVTENQTLKLSEAQALRRAEHALNDYKLGNIFLEIAERNTDPKDLPKQFERMEKRIADRDILTERLEAEENQQRKNENRLLSANVKLTESTQKLASEEKKLLELKTQIAMSETKGLKDTPDHNKLVSNYSDKQDAVSTAKNNVARKTWECTKLERVKAENETRDKLRLDNATKNEAEANTLLTQTLNPTISKEDRKRYKSELNVLKSNQKKEREKENTAYPKVVLADREKYRKNLESAEEKILTLNEKKSSLEIDTLKVAALPAIEQPAAESKNAKNKNLNDMRNEKIQRREKDRKLVYEFSNALIQANAQNPDPKKLEEQFSILETAEKQQKELRKQISAVDKKLNASPSQNSEKQEQLNRKKKDLELAHDHVHALIQDAAKTNNATAADLAKNTAGLKGQLSMLQTSIKERDKYTQELEKLSGAIKKNEEKDNAKIARKISRRKELEDKIAAEKIILQDLNNATNKNLRAIEKQEARIEKLTSKYNRKDEKIKLLDTQKDENVAANKALIENAKQIHENANLVLQANAINKPSLAEGTSNFKPCADATASAKQNEDTRKNEQKKASLLLVATQKYNKLTKRAEKLKETAEADKRKDAQNIENATRLNTELEEKMQNQKIALTALLETANPDPIAIAKQQTAIEISAAQLTNQSIEINRLQEIQLENEEKYKLLIANAVNLQKTAKNAQEEVQKNLNKDSTSNKTKVKAKFKPHLKAAALVEKEEQDRKDKQQKVEEKQKKEQDARIQEQAKELEANAKKRDLEAVEKVKQKQEAEEKLKEEEKRKKDAENEQKTQANKEAAITEAKRAAEAEAKKAETAMNPPPPAPPPPAPVQTQAQASQTSVPNQKQNTPPRPTPPNMPKPPLSDIQLAQQAYQQRQQGNTVTKNGEIRNPDGKNVGTLEQACLEKAKFEKAEKHSSLKQYANAQTEYNKSGGKPQSQNQENVQPNANNQSANENDPSRSSTNAF